jgi:hypothetical protein
MRDRNKVDIKENDVLRYDRQLLTILLKVQPPADTEAADLQQSNIAHNAWKNVQVTESLGSPDSL